MLISCGDKTSKTTVETDSLNATPLQEETAGDAFKHSQEYITQRIDSIYKYRDDDVCCSNRYNELKNQACKIADELEDL